MGIETQMSAMKTIASLVFAFLVAFASAGPVSAADAEVKLVAAENFYGNIAHQIGGLLVEVTSVMSNPDQDPHLFETSPAVVRQLAAAQIVIYNGADYDPWMPKLLKVASRPGRAVIVAADLVHKTPGDNPHLWYDPPTMPAVARALAAALSKADPDHAADFQARLKTFLASLKPLNDKIAAIRKKYGGAPVTASEPVFGYMATALGLKMRNERFQLSIMNDTEPSARDIAAFERDLKEHKVRAMFYNKQASDKIVQHLVELARANKVPVVGVTETIPPGMNFQDWMASELNDTEKALAGPSS
jgi:zinc/manganese transport system substrate-binding protein